MTYATVLWAKELNFTPILEAFKDWVVSMKPVVDAIAGAFEDFYIKVLLPLGKWSIEKGLPELIQIFTDFNDKVEWDTIRERLNKVWEALEPFAETVGEGLLIFIQKVSDAVANFLNSDKWDAFIDTLIKWMKEVKPEQIANGLEIISGALLAFKGLSFLSTVVTGITSLTAALSGLAAVAGTIGVVTAAIVALGIAVYSFVESFGGVENAVARVKESLDRMGEAFEDLSKKIDLSGKFDALKQSLKGLTDQLGNMQNFWEVVITVIEKVGTVIGVWLVENIRNGIRTFASLINTISSWLKGVEGYCEMLVGIVTLNGDKIKEGAKKLWESIKGIFSNGIDWIAGLVHAFCGNIVGLFKGLKYALVGDPIVIDMWNAIEKVFSQSIGKVVNFVKNFKQNIIQLFKDIFNSVVEILNNIVDKFMSFKSDIEQKVQEVKDAIKKKIDDIKQDITDFISDVKEFFSADKWTLDGVAEGLRKTFENAKDAIKDVWNSIADKLNGDFEIGGATLHINLPKFAKGGFPEDDSLFLANSTEMVGKFSNGQNVVANNQQITEGIAQAVYSAIMSANGSGLGGNPQYINNTIQVDGETIARAVTKGQKSIDRRYSPTMA